ncbi:MAG: hypothetical protein JXR83_10290 [Deltaproteobacteria bacterium]|nr:hypothetical protein [Deltaproteobacteria bacterium]
MKLRIHPIVLKVALLLLLMIGSAFFFELNYWIELALANVAFLLLLLGIEEIRGFLRDRKNVSQLLTPLAGIVLLALAVAGSVRSSASIATREYDFVPLLMALDDFKARHDHCPDRLLLLGALEPKDEVLYDTVNFTVRRRGDGTKYTYRCSENGYQLWFEHHMFIKHQYESQLGRWVDWK